MPEPVTVVLPSAAIVPLLDTCPWLFSVVSWVAYTDPLLVTLPADAIATLPLALVEPHRVTLPWLLICRSPA